MKMRIRDENRYAKVFLIVLISAFVVLVIASLLKSFLTPRIVYETYPIWTQGELEDITTYHQFGLLTTKQGTLLATCEARVAGSDAGDPHHIVLKRSTDNGKTWGETIFVADYREDVCSTDENITTEGYSGHCYANPTLVEDEESGRIFIFYSENFDNASSKLFYRTSDDDGLSWSEPVELTGLFEDDAYDREFHLPGPGHGLQIQNGTYAGRLVVEVWHRHSNSNNTLEEREYGISMIYSDDGGETWVNSEYLPVGYDMGEGRIAEISDGVLLMNSRITEGNTRMYSVSNDGGESWSEPVTWTSMGTYGSCDSGFVSEIRGKTVTLLTSHLAEGSNRDSEEFVCLTKQ